jgi:hypothetical protein
MPLLLLPPPLLLLHPACRFLNDVLGALCVSLYAWFDYR